RAVAHDEHVRARLVAQVRRDGSKAVGQVVRDARERDRVCVAWQASEHRLGVWDEYPVGEHSAVLDARQGLHPVIRKDWIGITHSRVSTPTSDTSAAAQLEGARDQIARGKTFDRLAGGYDLGDGLVTDRKPFRGCWPETDEEWIDLAPCDSDGPHQRRAGVAQLRLATVLPREMIRREA